MPQFRISQGDAAYNVTVPDEFLNLPQEQQNAQLTAAFQAQAGGTSPSPPTPPPPDTSLLGAFGSGLNNTAHNFGRAWGAIGMPGAETLKQINLAPHYQPADVSGDFASGNYAALPGDVIRKGAEMLPAVAGLGAAFAAGAAAPEAYLGATTAMGAYTIGDYLRHRLAGATQ